jgi:hypothetical protein
MAGWSCVESCVTIGAAWVMGVVDGVDMGNFMGCGCTPSLVGGKRGSFEGSTLQTLRDENITDGLLYVGRIILIFAAILLNQSV